MSFLAEVIPSIESWWTIGQKIGSGAAFIMGIALVFLWRAYQKELIYSKERDRQMLTVMLELTSLIQGIQKRGDDETRRQEKSTDVLLAAIADLKNLIVDHQRGPRRHEQ